MDGARSSSKKDAFAQRCEILIGVLAVQGSFYEHINAITRLKDDVYAHTLLDVNGLKVKNVEIKVVDIRSPKDVSSTMRGLIIPGKIAFLRWMIYFLLVYLFQLLLMLLCLF